MNFLIHLFLFGQLKICDFAPSWYRFKRADFNPFAVDTFGQKQRGSPTRPNQPDPLRPEHIDPSNPYLESMNDPYYPAYGLGVVYHAPTIVGGEVNFPTGNLFHPTDTVNGTFAVTGDKAVHLGTEGGPFYPWMTRQYGNGVQNLSLLEYRQVQQASLIESARQNSYSQPASGSVIEAARQMPAFYLATPPPVPLAFAQRDDQRVMRDQSTMYGGTQTGARLRQTQQQLPAYMLATPPPLPPRFS